LSDKPLRYMHLLSPASSSAVPGPRDARLKEHFANYDWAVRHHVEHSNIALAGYVTALGIAQATDVGTPLECFRRERDWQSAWMVRELRLV
jgi:hypothetical protein